MKFLYAICLVLGTGLLLSSCKYRGNDVKISMREDDKEFKFSARYPENKTRKVARLINKGMAPGSFPTSGNVHFDATTTMGDRTMFYIKFSPGDLTIKLDRDKNTPDAYRRIREMCEEIKEELK